MKFTLNNIDYEILAKNGKLTGYCYKTENGKKTRISLAAFNEAQEEYIAQQNAKIAEEEETAVEVEITDNLGANTANTYKDEPVPAKKKPAKRTRKSKDVAFSMHMTTEADPEETDANLITLTAKQVDFMKHLPDTCFWENGLDSKIWVDCLCDDIGGQFKSKPMTVGAMISTLCEKGIGRRFIGKIDKHKATAFELTEIGKVIAAELGIE